MNLAFFFLNRFLDVCDAIESPDSAEIDNSDFLETDLPTPYEVRLGATSLTQSHIGYQSNTALSQNLSRQQTW